MLATFALAMLPLVNAVRVAHQNAGDDYLIRELSRWGGQFELDESVTAEILSQSTNPELHTAVAAHHIAQQVAAGGRALAMSDPEQTFNHAAVATIDARRAEFYLRAMPQRQPAAAVLLPGQSIAALRTAHQHALIALILCPLHDAARFRLLQTGFAAQESRETVIALLSQWGRLRLRYAAALDRAARLAAIYPGREAALPLIRQLLVVDPGRLAAIWPVFELLGGPESFSELLPDDPQVLLQAVQSQVKDPQLKATLTLRVRELVAEPSDGSSAAERAYLLGRLEQSEGNAGEAQQWFQRAVAADPSTTIYRFHWAEMLHRTGNRAEAIEQIQRCVFQEPGNRQYEARRKLWLTAAGPAEAK